MTKAEIKAKARELYALADKCGVPMLRACAGIGMATSTPHRWLKFGSTPSEGQMIALRASILRTADKRGTLPKAHQAEFDALGAEPPPRSVRPAKDIARQIARDAQELEQSLALGS